LQEFEKRRSEADFLESAEVFGYHYGSSRRFVEEKLAQGKHVFLVIDTQGALALKKSGFPAILIFLSPPSFEELARRLKERRTDDAAVIATRLEWARQEIQRVHQYDYHIVNDYLEDAYAVLRSIVIAEEHRIHKE
jgi:guanylate kinase